MSQNQIGKRHSLMISVFSPATPPPFVESKDQENYQLCRINPNNGSYLPPTPNEKSGNEKWHDNQEVDYFSFPVDLARPNKPHSKHSTHAFVRLETSKEYDRTFIKSSQKTNVESPKTTTVDDDNLVLQLEDATLPPMSPSLSCSTSSTSEESDVDDLNSNTIHKHKHIVSQKSYTGNDLSDFIRHSGFSMKDTKKPETPSILRRNFF